MPRTSSSSSQLRSNSQKKRQKQQNQPKFLQESKLKPITLSSQIDFSLLKDADKISAVYRSITVLDYINQLNVISAQIKTLYLSNNFISDIEHIKQFPNLESLSLGFNQICKISCLRYLSFLPKLTILCLQGNPIARHPLYEVYIMGVTANNHQLKSMDGKKIVAKTREEGIRNWDVYELNMKQLLTNYLKMVNLIQFNKRQAINYVLKIAACNMQTQINKFQVIFHQGSKLQGEKCFGPDSLFIQQKTRLNKCVDLCLKQTQLELQYLPIKYVMNLEDILNEDVLKLSNKRLEQLRNKQGLKQNNSLSINLISERPIKNASLSLVNKLRIVDKVKIVSQVEIFISSMYQLLQRQKQRIEEISQKIYNLYDSLFSQGYQNTSKTYRDIEKVEEKLERVFRFIQKEQLYYQWKIINRYFQKLKQDTHKKINKRQGINKINRILILKISPNMKQALAKIQACSRIFIIKQAVHILCRLSERYQGQIYNICFRTLKDRTKYMRCHRIIQNPKNKSEKIQRIGKIEKSHNQQNDMLSIDFDDEPVYPNLYNQPLALNQSFQSTRWQNKKTLIKCWNQWVKVHHWSKLEEENRNLKQKLKQNQVREQKLRNKICLLQQINQITQQKSKKPQETDLLLKQLINQIQRDCSTLKQKVKKQTLSPPSSVKRTHSLSGSEKQSGVEHGTIQINNRQRKFNCSRRNLKICHEHLDTN